ncbi:MAG: cytotoxic translational repressor of toxin-antitoxin stability system [Flavobacteriales bacterium]|nr:cytotoxic translational repressor of toxin-antitoxin stability system [Flavobacteriales bacterium]
MNWTVSLTKKVAKAIPKLPKPVRQSLFVLLGEIESSGPVRGNWKNYSKLGQDIHHCHLKKGQPTYVAVWEVTDKEIKLIEVIYVGSHEKAPY